MAQQQPGRRVNAQPTFKRLREVMKNPWWAGDGEARAFLREAEALLKPQDASPKK